MHSDVHVLSECQKESKAGWGGVGRRWGEGGGGVCVTKTGGGDGRGVGWGKLVGGGGEVGG